MAPLYRSISQFCATCHSNFHTLKAGNPDDIGETRGSPLSAIPQLSFYHRIWAVSILYNRGDGYRLTAPVARTTVPATSSSTFTAGNDAVIRLSCHRGHAPDYPDMLRWNYGQMIASGSGADRTGCFVCHTTKD